MHPARVDDIVRAVSLGGSRRQVLGGALAALVPWALPGVIAGAARRGHRARPCAYHASRKHAKKKPNCPRCRQRCKN